jgi:pimeloyl-ACP methyl ester carboxylesterase
MLFFRCCIFALLITPLANAESLIFEQGGNYLSGHYLAPLDNQPAKAVLLFVHGDSALSYNAEGYYDIIWQLLRERGYAVFSWDKPGVGDSSGNWLLQSMADRQAEVLAAVHAVQENYKFESSNTGLIGFSQAGWVLPRLASDTDNIGFIIGVGFARSWLEQGLYHTETRLKLIEADRDQIASQLHQRTKEIEFFESSPSYYEYLEFVGQDAMKKDRYDFVLKNRLSDASLDNLNIKVPSLLMWGEADLNVDAKSEFSWWQSPEHNNQLVSTKLIPNASHGMLKADIFNTQSFSFTQWLKLIWMGEDAFVAEFFSTMLPWLESYSKKAS